MWSPRNFVVCVAFLVTAVCCVPAVAQLSFTNFNSIGALAVNGSANQATNGGGQQVLRLTQDGSQQQAGSAWYTTQQPVSQGFTTVFQFQITHSVGSGPADGFAFLIQNSTNFDCGDCETGPTNALGGPGGDLGYGSQPYEELSPIDNSIAIEFDTYQNGWDPNNNHVAVQSCGTANNTQEHYSTYPTYFQCTSGPQSGKPATLGIAPMPGLTLADGNVHTVTLQYAPGTLKIFIDNNGTPVLTVPVTIGTLLNLNAGMAYVGFTGATGAATENNDILSWYFTPQGTQSITQNLTPGPGDNFTNYVFGGFNHKYEYTGANLGDTVTVTAVPLSPATVNSYLSSYTPPGGSPGQAVCVAYSDTEGNCVVLEATCTPAYSHANTDCGSPSIPGSGLLYTLYESYNTNQFIGGPCLLKTEDVPPTSHSVWTNIEVVNGFTQSRYDPTNKGNTNGFSSFVVADCAPWNGHNCNGSYSETFPGDLTISAGQSCTFTGGGVTGNVTQTGGTFSISGSTVGNNLTVQGGGTFTIGPSTAIGGNLQVQNLPTSGGTDTVCGATIKGNLQLQNSGTAVQIGSASGCAGNMVGGDLQVQNDTASTTIYANTVGGNLTDQNNTASTVVSNNTVGNNLTAQNNTAGTTVDNNVVKKNLQCNGNSNPFSESGNTAGAYQGQCPH